MLRKHERSGKGTYGHSDLSGDPHFVFSRRKEDIRPTVTQRLDGESRTEAK
jgi:hypothetical protein